MFYRQGHPNIVGSGVTPPYSSFYEPGCVNNVLISAFKKLTL